MAARGKPRMIQASVEVSSDIQGSESGYIPLKFKLNIASVVKLVDTMDSKSIAFTGVAVRVRPLVPLVRNFATLPSQ
jgi:hypothetical protein